MSKNKILKNNNLDKLEISSVIVMKIKNKLNITLKENEIYIDREGIKKHIYKRGHSEVYEFIDKIDEIVSNPDYIGINPNEKGVSFETIKLIKKNILVGIKYDYKNKYFYVSSMYEKYDRQLEKMIKSKRIKKF